MIVRHIAAAVAATTLVVLIGCAGEARKPEAAKAPEAPKGETLTSGDYSMVLPLGLQASSAYIPEKNPLTEKKVELGRQLYFDPRLSKDGTVSCATCHSPEKGFSDGRASSAGIGGQTGNRNAPTVWRRRSPRSSGSFWPGMLPTIVTRRGTRAP